MTKTVADLLNQIKIEHKIPADHPVLSTPLSDFEEDDYPDVVTILWLFGEGWADPALVPEESTKLGIVSAQKVEEFYNEIHDKLTKAISIWNLSKKNSEKIKTLKIEGTPKDSWVSPAQVTHWLNDLALFHILFPRIKSKQISLIVKNSPVLEKNKMHGPMELDQHLVDASSPGIVFKSHYLTSQYSTLQKLCDILGIEFPKNLNTNLAYILKLDISNLKLTEKQLTELMYYTLLFIYGYASLDTALFNCTYIDKQTVKNLHRVAEVRAGIVRTHLESKKPVTNLYKFLGDELKLNQCTLHPNLLGLICFENCPLLKVLHIQSWQAQELDVEKMIQLPSIALFPVNNPFILGGILCSTTDNPAVSGSLNDLILIVKLMTLMAIAKSQRTPFFSSTDIAKSASQCQKEFDQLKGQIKNPIVRKSMNAQQLETYTLTLLINHSALAEFIGAHGIQAQVQNAPSEEMLGHFLALFNPTDVQTIKGTIERLASSKQFINLDDTDNLASQIVRVQRSIELLTEKLAQESESSKLTNEWFRVQKTIWSRFEVLLMEKYKEVEAGVTTQSFSGLL